MKLIPMPKSIKKEATLFLHETVHVITSGLDDRITKALTNLPLSEGGAPMEIKISRNEGEAYSLEIREHNIVLEAEGLAGAFYGIQTLRQIFTHSQIPCLYIEDKPDFGYRGFYHDVTRGRVPTVEAMKKLIDEMAYYKMNSLQLYIEHTFAFREFADSMEQTGYLTAEEIKELDDYCYQNFIEFVPSIATFGHLYELLQKEEYKELQAVEGYEPKHYMWMERMLHHTVDPVNPKSFELVKSLIDQYMPLFRSDKFNICCDETFDLEQGRHKGEDTAKLYVDFVNKLVEYIRSKGKTVMMWADILLKHPESIENLSDGIQFLNWCYGTEVKEADMEVFVKNNKPQIVCPGTQTWAVFCPNITYAEINISRMIELGYKHGAIGVLNTNWGDYGHICSLGLCMYEMVLGAEKSWSVSTKFDADFVRNVNHLLFKHDHALEIMRWLSALQINGAWSTISCYYSNTMFQEKLPVPIPAEDIVKASQIGCQEFVRLLSQETWEQDGYREEMLIAAEGMQIVAELFAQIAGYPMERNTSTKEWLKKYRKKWLEESKESELCEIEKLFLAVEHACSQ